MVIMQVKFLSKEHLCEINIHKQKFPLIAPDQLMTVARDYSRCAIITKANVFRLYGKLLSETLRRTGKSVHEIILPAGDDAKSLLSVQRCWKILYDEGFDRHSCVIALGGESISDSAGFAAATYMQGLDIIHIPTTLMSMVNIPLEGSTAINFADGKNLLGVRHPPRFIWVFPSLLNTLPEREFRSGLAQIIKYGVIKNPLLFDYLDKHLDLFLAKDPEQLYTIIESCCAIKAEIIQQGQMDRALSQTLAWGQTFSNAIEKATNYSQYLPGEAMAIGMSCSAHLSHLLGYSNKDLAQKQDTLTKRAGLPLDLPKISPENLIKFIERDKKNKYGTINLVLAEKIGKAFRVPDIETAKIREMLDQKNLSQ